MKAKRNTKIIRQCLTCGKDFHPLRASLTAGNGYYCSIGCASRARTQGEDNFNYAGGNVKRICEVCGCEFFIPKAWCNSNTKHAGKYCSWDCMGVARRDKKNYFWKDGGWKKVGRVGQTKWARAILKRDNGTCQFCGAIKNLDTHHIDSYLNYPEKRLDIDNGITLCRSCHIWVHTKEQNSRWYFDALKEPSETTRLASFNSGDDIVRSMQRCIEASRNDLPTTYHM